MIHSNHCQQCGAVIPESTGVCPQCLLQQALGDVLSSELAQTTPIYVAKKGQSDSTMNIRLPESSTVSGQVSQYDIIELLGRGGMGIVHKAWDRQLKRFVALKRLSIEEEPTAEQVSRFRQEAEAVAKLQHPNIVQIYEVGEEEELPFLALEFVEGHSLARHFQGIAWMPQDAAKLVETLSRAIHFAHQHGIVHRDLKPGNILVSSLDDLSTVKITDFGLAHLADGSHQQTQTGVFLGTPSYCAPEQALGKRDLISPATDTYALGAILYELLTGQIPFVGANVIDTLHQVVDQEPIRPSNLNRSIPKDLETICLRCLEKKPERRYANSEALADDLRRWLNHEPIHAKQITWRDRMVKWVQRHPAGAALIATISIAFAMLVGLVIFLMLYQRLQDEKANVEKQRLLAEQATREAEKQRDLTRRVQYASDLVLAERAWSDNDLVRMIELLNRQIPSNTAGQDLRGFEWYYLYGLLHEAKRVLRPQFRCRIRGSSFSADGRYLAFSTDRHILRVWDVLNNRVHFRVGTKHFCHTIALSKDGTRLLAGSDSGGIYLFDVHSQKQLLHINESGLNVRKVAFFPDENSIACSVEHGIIYGWNIKTQKRTLTIAKKKLQKQSPNVAFHSTTGHCAVPQETNVDIYDRIGTKLKTLNDHPSKVHCVAWDSSGTRLAVGCRDGSIVLWDTRRIEQPLATLHKHESIVRFLEFHPNGTMLASTGEDRKVMLWNTQRKKRIRLIQGHTEWITGIHFRPNSDELLTTSADGTLKFWNIHQPMQPSLLSAKMSSDSPKLHAISEDGRLLVNKEFSPGRFLVLELTSGRELQPILMQNQEDDNVIQLDLNKDGSRLAVIYKSKYVEVYNVHAQQLSWRKQLNDMIPQSVTLSLTGKLLAIGGTTGKVQLWNAETGKLIRIYESGKGSVRCLAFDQTGTRLAAACLKQGELIVWNLNTGLVSFRVKDSGDIYYTYRLQFSPDGKFLYGDFYRDVESWNLETGQKNMTFQWSPSGADAFCLSPDGQRLASGSGQGVIRIWSTKTGQLTFTTKLSSRINGIQFSSDGNRLICVSNAGVQVFEAAAQEQRQEQIVPFE